MTTRLADHFREERLPRYTSYPTAPMFSASVSNDSHAEWLCSLDAKAIGSLYLHVPFCRSMCWYCGCHTTVARRDAPIANYLDVLGKEIALIADTLDHPLAVGHVHFGGGTPTIMAAQEFRGLMALLRQRFRVEPGAEIATEIDPRTLTRDMIDALGETGVNRASLGVQSFDPLVQGAINRIQGLAQTAEATAGLRAAGVRGINFDLVYGLPHQTVRSCIETVEQCLALRPDRFAVFGYAHIPTFKKHQRKIDESVLPDGAARLDQAEAISQSLVRAGYRQIGLDHFALEDDSLVRAQASGRLHRNFQGYTTDACEVLIGLGASAISRFPQGYVQNEVALGSHAQRVLQGELPTARGYRLTAEDRLRADVIERLMCDFEVDLGDVCARHGATPAILAASRPRLEALAANGVLRLDGHRIQVEAGSRIWIRTVAAAFDAHREDSGRTYSRAV